MSTLTITRGLPGSGKTTWAKAWVAEAPEARVRVNRDHLRDMLHGTRRGLSNAQEAAVTVASHAAVRAALAAGRSVVVDDMHLRPRYIRDWQRLATEAGAELVIHELPVDVERTIARDAARDERDRIGEEAIRRLAGKFLPRGDYLPIKTTSETVFGLAEPSGPAPYVPDPSLDRAILVDVDGTVALMGDRSPYDWARVGEDAPNEPVVDLLNYLDHRYHIIYLSGRDESCRYETEEWLACHVGVVNEGLFMRPEGDSRRDDIVKAELFDRHIRGRWDIRFVLDDRDSVVAMWRAMGLTCLQVAPGNF